MAEGQAKPTLISLPPELLREICSYLPLPDLKKCRLLCNSLRFAGEPSLLPILNLTFESSSFDRLKEICQNPLVCSGVRQIHYEISHLVCSPSFYHLMEWEKRKEGKEPSKSTTQNQISADWRPSVSEFSQLLTDIAECPGYYSDRDFHVVCKAFQIICRDQEKLRQAGHNLAIFTQAFKKLPNLTAVTMNVLPYYRIGPWSLAPVWQFMAGFPSAIDNEMHCEHDILQMESLLTSAIVIQRPLKHLNCKLLSTSLFSQVEDDFASTVAGLEQLKHLKLTIDPDHHEAPFDVSSRTGRLSTFLAAASNLECLQLEWGEQEGHDINLGWAMGAHTWSSLRTLDLWYVNFSVDELKAFLRRHATTLRDFKLAFARLNVGLWAPTFLFMREQLTLETFTAYNLFEGDDLPAWIPCGEHVARTNGNLEWDPHGNKLKDIISRYVTGNGHRPLIHRDQTEFGEYLVDDGHGGRTVQRGEP